MLTLALKQKAIWLLDNTMTTCVLLYFDRFSPVATGISYISLYYLYYHLQRFIKHVSG